MPLQMIAALAAKKVMEREHLKGTLMIWPRVSAHAAGSPWRGKSALDAVELVDAAWDFFRNVQTKDVKYKRFFAPGGRAGELAEPGNFGEVPAGYEDAL